VLHLGDLPPARGDQALLRQVWVNLLSNAVKYTAPTPEAVIEVGGSQAGGENTYRVKDNGVGFDMRYVDKLFGVFQRLHGDGEFEGTGIGLAIVKRIVTRHGGRVWAESKPGEGSTLYFTLPAREDRVTLSLIQRSLHRAGGEESASVNAGLSLSMEPPCGSQSLSISFCFLFRKQPLPVR
jgi:light-regulated signal transduction histidine kinase (bacteriophytochrome)